MEKRRNIVYYLDDVDTLDEDDDDVDTELDVDTLKEKTSVSENILYKSSFHKHILISEIHNSFL